MASSSYSSSPCAACKLLRRKCLSGCIFAPYFPPEEPQKFMNVHKIFGASNVSKLLNEILPHEREDAVNSLAYEAEARIKNPVYGCVGVISVLQRQVLRLQKELDATNADLARYTGNGIMLLNPLPVSTSGQLINPTVGRRLSTSHGYSGGSNLDRNSELPDLHYNYPWNYNPSEDGSGSMQG